MYILWWPFHNGSTPIDVDLTVRFIKKLVDHYREHAPVKEYFEYVRWWTYCLERFNEVLDKQKNTIQLYCRMLTNGSRTLRYWEKNAKILMKLL